MNIRKSLAGIAAGSLALAGVAVATAPTASAWTGTATSTCHLFFGSGNPGTPGSASIASSNSTFSITGVSQVPANPNAGDVVTVTVTSPGVTNGPAQVAPGSLAVTGKASITGAMTATVPLTIVGAYPVLTGSNDNLDGDSLPGSDGLVDPNSPMGPITLTGTYTATGNGAASIAYQQTYIDDSSGANADNYCDGTVFSPLTSPPATWSPKLAPAASATALQAFSITGPNAAVSSITGQAAGVTGYARSTNVITLAGSVWANNVTAGGFTTTVGGAAATNTLTTNGSGVLAGTVTVPAGATTGLTSIGLTQGGNSATVPITILGAGTVTLSPASGGVGATVTVTGSNWNPSSLHYVFPYKSNPFAGRGVAGGGALYCPSGATTLATVGPFVPVDVTASANPSAISAVALDSASATDATGVAGTYQGSLVSAGPPPVYSGIATTTSGSGTGATVRIVRAAGTLLPTASLFEVGSGYAIGDTITVPAGATGAGSAALTLTVNNVGSRIDTAGANAGQTCGTTGQFTSSATGTLSGSFTVAQGMLGVFVTEATTGSTYPAGITGSQSNGRAVLDNTFVVSSDTCTRQVGSATPTLCETKQNVSATVTAGSLSQTAVDYDGTGTAYTSTSIPFGSIQTGVTAGTLTAHLNPITVSDSRGGAAVWSLTAAMPSLSDGAGGSIANSNMKIGTVAGGSTSALACGATAAGSATGANVGAQAQDFSASAVTLCTKNGTADSAGGTTGGRYQIDAGLTLNIPAFQKASSYTSVITITLT